MKLTIRALVLLSSLTTLLVPAQTLAMDGGRNRGGSKVLTLAGVAAASAGVWYLIKNGINDKNNKISSDLAVLDRESANFGAAPNTASTSVVENNVPHRFGQANHKTISTTIQDQASEKQRNIINTRNILISLQENLLPEEYSRLAKAKAAYDQTVQQNLDVTAQAATLGELKTVIKDLKKKYPHDAAADTAIMGIILGTVGIVLGMPR